MLKPAEVRKFQELGLFFKYIVFNDVLILKGAFFFQQINLFQLSFITVNLPASYQLPYIGNQ